MLGQTDDDDDNDDDDDVQYLPDTDPSIVYIYISFNPQTNSMK